MFSPPCNFFDSAESRPQIVKQRSATKTKKEETFAQLENRIPEARIGDFSGRPAPAAERLQRRLFEREARVSSLQRSEEAQGRKMSSARRDHDFQSSQEGIPPKK
jgi:hypothetical protein